MTNLDKLPEQCFYKLPTTGETILIRRGEKGYYPQTDLKHRNPDELNELFDVTKAQASAMYGGSMFGWDAPISDPDNYDEDGNHKRR